MRVIGEIAVGWVGLSVVAVFGWVGFVEACRYRERRLSLEPSMPSSAATPAAAAGAEKAAAQISDRLIRDFHVVRDEMGAEIIVPVEDASRSGA